MQLQQDAAADTSDGDNENVDQKGDQGPVSISDFSSQTNDSRDPNAKGYAAKRNGKLIERGSNGFVYLESADWNRSPKADSKEIARQGCQMSPLPQSNGQLNASCGLY